MHSGLFMTDWGSFIRGLYPRQSIPVETAWVLKELEFQSLFSPSWAMLAWLIQPREVYFFFPTLKNGHYNSLLTSHSGHGITCLAHCPIFSWFIRFPSPPLAPFPRAWPSAYPWGNGQCLSCSLMYPSTWHCLVTWRTFHEGSEEWPSQQSFFGIQKSPERTHLPT